MLKFWPFKRQKKNAAGHVIAPALPTGGAPSVQPAAPAGASDGRSTGGPLKTQAMLYLEATLAVLQRERIPLGSPVHGRPARGARFVEIPIHLDRRRVGPMAMRKIFSHSTLKAIEAAARVDGLNIWQVRDAIVYQYQLDRAMWKFYKRTDLPSPDGIGLGVGRSLVPFELDNKNTLVAGETRSGKSVTIESILFALMGSYSREELGLVIIDPNQTLGIRKEGLKAVEVGSFTNAAHLLRPIAYSPEQIKAALNFVYRQWLHRMRNGIQDAPGLVLVIDELMSEYVLGDKDSGSHQQSHLEKLTQLASQGIKNNIFLVVGAQDPRVGNTSGLFMRNLGLRFIGQVTDDAASRALAGRSGINAHLLTGNGDFVRVTSSEQLRFQVAEPVRQDFERLERRQVAAEAVEPITVVEVPPPATAEHTTPLDATLLFPDDDLEPDSGGRPEVGVDAYTLAIYFHEKKLSVRGARSQYGIRRLIHERHLEFARQLQDEILSLRRGQPPRSSYYQPQGEV